MSITEVANDNRAPAITVWAVPYKPSLQEEIDALHDMQFEGVEHTVKNGFMFIWSLSLETTSILKEQLAPLHEVIKRLSVDEQYIERELR